MTRIRVVIKILDLYSQRTPVKAIYAMLKNTGIKVSRSFVYRTVKPFKFDPVESSTENPWNQIPRH